MSIQENDVYLEDKYQEFKEADLESKLRIIKELRDQGFEKEAQNMEEQMIEDNLKYMNDDDVLRQIDQARNK